MVSPMGTKLIDVQFILVVDLLIDGNSYSAELIIFDMLEFDIILGMDWLIQHEVQIDC